MAEQKSEQKVLIIGAGVVGLLIANGLQKEGIPCTVYESEPSATHYRAREWGMSIQWGLPLLKECFTEEKFQNLYTVSVDPTYEPPDVNKMPTYNGETGELITNIPLMRFYRVPRRKFRAYCAEGVDVQYGKVLTDLQFSDTEKSVTAQFEDGTSATGTLVVGADGVHSKTRHIIFNHDTEQAAAQPIAFNALNYHVCYNDAEKAKFVREAHPIIYHAIHPKGYWLFISTQEVPDPEKPETWVFQLQCTWKKGAEGESADEDVGNMERHLERAQSFGEPFKSANLWMPKDTKLNINRISYWMPRKWDTRGGRAMLAGDAAHAMTFHRGQGLNHGIADAANLTKLMREVVAGTKSQEAVVEEYVDELVPRAGEEVKMSVMNTEMMHDWTKFSNSPFFKKGGHANQSNKVALEETRHKEEQKQS